MHNHYWPVGFTWWTATFGIMLVAVYWMAITASKATAAKWVIPVACACGLIGGIPLTLWIGSYADLPGVLAFSAFWSALSVIPMWITTRRIGR